MAGLSVLFCLLGFIFTVKCEAWKPGFQTRITSRAIDYANEVAVNVLTKKLRDLSIPDVHGNDHGVAYDITGIQIKKLDKPRSKINIVPNSGLNWKMSDAGISLRANFKYKYKKGWIKVSDHGTIDAGADGVGFAVQITIGKDKTGRPLLGSKGCSVTIGSIHLKFHGGASWIYNLFKDPFTKALKKLIIGKLCEVLQNAIDNDAERAMQRLKMTAVLDRDFLLDYRLTDAPNFSAAFLETAHKGEIFWKSDPKEAPFKAPTMPPVPRSDKMLYLWVSEFLFNSAMYVAQQNNFLRYNLTAKDLPPDQRGVLDTSCMLMCVGGVIPKIRAKYPGTSVDLEMASSAPPHLQVRNGQLFIHFQGQIKMNALMKKQAPAYLLTLTSAMNITVNLTMHDEQIFGNLQDLNIDIGVKDSSVGSVNKKALQFLVNSAISIFVKPQINAFLRKGFPLPMTGNIKFKNTELRLLPNTLLVSTDVFYNETATQTGAWPIHPVLQQVLGQKSSYKIHTL